MNTLFKILPLFFLFVSVSSCGTSRQPVEKKKHITKNFSGSPESSRYLRATSTALDYIGTRYKYGGTSRKGMDCSGLIFTAFLEENIRLPRTARNMALKGTRLKLKEVEAGDLLFFETNKNRKVINHVGLVVEKRGGDLRFIHASTSRGVIISSLTENYWRNHFVMARRIN